MGRPGVVRARQSGTFHSLARPDQTDAAGRPSTDMTTGRPGTMYVSQWGISFTCPTIGVHDVYIYFYGLDPPRRPASETKNLTQPGDQVRTFLQADPGRCASVKGLQYMHIYGDDLDPGSFLRPRLGDEAPDTA